MDPPRPAQAPLAWSYTLAYAETPLRALALGEDELRAVVETLRAHNLPLPTELAASSARRAQGAPGGARYIWGFASLRDAIQVARAIRRSDYHAYPEPASLREASLDRLYRRFPLAEFPRARVILFTGASVCLDPLLGPDPAPGSLGAELPDALGPAIWERYTALGLRQGVALIRVTPNDRWVRLAPRTLEDAWAAGARALTALAAPADADDDVNGSERARRPAPASPAALEAAAFQALLCAATGTPLPEPAPSAPPRAGRRAHQGRGQRSQRHPARSTRTARQEG